MTIGYSAMTLDLLSLSANYRLPELTHIEEKTARIVPMLEANQNGDATNSP